jgi:hypothetical protein
MAAYTDKTKQYLQLVAHQQHWDASYSPGDIVPYSGIYRCRACGKEITSNGGDPFPPQNHHQHSPSRPISWHLIVRTDTDGNRFGL